MAGLYGYHMRRNQSGPEHRTFYSKKQNSYRKGAAMQKPALFQPLDHSTCLVSTPSKGTAHTEALWESCSRAGNESNDMKDGPYSEDFFF